MCIAYETSNHTCKLSFTDCFTEISFEHGNCFVVLIYIVLLPFLPQKAAVSPDVFISYQWGKQKQIMVLYRRLTGLGYTCWMDIHQMGGGDSLFDKIDRGVRGCRLVLSCITTKYALSANCRREVSLADALKKPIVPLLLESITWPPTGPMSMVFTQLLYINFSKDEKVQEKWVGKEFDELISKIESYVPKVTDGGKEAQSAPKNETKPTPAEKSSNTNTNSQTHKHSGNSQSPSKQEAKDCDENKSRAKREELSPKKAAKSSPEPQPSKSCILL